jgi:hypothetical protein
VVGTATPVVWGPHASGSTDSVEGIEHHVSAETIARLRDVIAHREFRE